MQFYFEFCAIYSNNYELSPKSIKIHPYDRNGIYKKQNIKDVY